MALGADRIRFATFYDVTASGCWVWNGAKTAAGYGEFQVAGRTVYAHRWSYEHHVGPIPTGLEVDHVCHSRDRLCPEGPCAHRACVNPAHLEPVTTSENQRRSRERSL